MLNKRSLLSNYVVAAAFNILHKGVCYIYLHLFFNFMQQVGVCVLSHLKTYVYRVAVS